MSSAEVLCELQATGMTKCSGGALPKLENSNNFQIAIINKEK